MHYGNLGLKVLRLELAQDHVKHPLCIHVRVRDIERVSKETKTLEFDDMLNFNVEDLNDVCTISVCKGDNVLGDINLKVNDLLTIPFTPKHLKFSVTGHGEAVLHFDAQWTSKTATQKYLGETAARMQGEAAALFKGDPHTAMALHPAHRPYFMRVSFFYHVAKRTYAYATSFPIVNRVARLNESIANHVSTMVLHKSLYDIDANAVVPVLNRLDDSIDTSIHTVMTQIFRGQKFIIQKKNAACDTVAHAAKRSTSSFTGIFGVGADAATAVTHFTVSSIWGVCFGMYRGARHSAVYMTSHIPYVGAKIRT